MATQRGVRPPPAPPNETRGCRPHAPPNPSHFTPATAAGQPREGARAVRIHLSQLQPHSPSAPAHRSGNPSPSGTVPQSAPRGAQAWTHPFAGSCRHRQGRGRRGRHKAAGRRAAP